MTSNRSLVFVLSAAVCMIGCGRRATEAPKPQKWATGFWFWQGSSASSAATGPTVDAIYIQTGTIRLERLFVEFGKQWRVEGYLPDRLPPAREYWLVFRYNEMGVPAPEFLPELGKRATEELADARHRRLNVVGIQLDIDSPTRRLPEYAKFLRGARQHIPAGLEISITALLDWFRDGTAIADVIAEVDEFVPQFYDAQGSMSSRRTAIAAPIQAAKWRPVLNAFRKRFRIGISSFGRCVIERSEQRAKAGSLGLSLSSDLKPMTVAANRAFQLETAKTEAQDLVLSYRATRKTRIGYGEFEPGDAVHFIVPTPEGIAGAVEQAKSMGGYCAGALFFRWPAFNEALAAAPGDVLRAAGVEPQKEPSAELRVSDGGCAAVYCADLYLLDTPRLSPKPLRYRIRSSSGLEYFVPSDGVPAGMSPAGDIEFLLPPYSGQPLMRLGRAVAAQRSAFTLEEAR